MPVRELSANWMETRSTLQRYAQTLTAFPRAAADPDPRWSHVSMDPTPSGFASAATPLADGTALESEIDLVSHLIAVTAGNVVGGAGLVGGMYWFIYLRPRAGGKGGEE
jgi:hypothetical protein